MDKSKNSKIRMSFDRQILSVRFIECSDIGLIDIQFIYEFGNEKSKGQPYCILFTSPDDFNISEDAAEYIADNPNNKHILAKAYIVNTKTSKTRAKFHIMLDKPTVKPSLFDSETEALNWLNNLIASSDS